MLDAIASAAWKRPWALLGAAIALLALLALPAAGARDQLGHPPEAGTGEGDLLVVASAEGAVTDAVYRAALDVIAARIEAETGVSEAVVAEPAGRDGIAVLLVDAAGASAAEQRRLAADLATEIDPGPLDVRVEGRIAELVAAEESVLDDLWRLELLIVPLAALVLVAALGARLAVGPPLCAAIAVAGALAGLAVAGSFADLSVLAIAPAVAVAVGLGIELAALLIGRWEDEVRLSPPDEALRNTLSEGAGTLGFAALAAVLAGAGIAAVAIRDALEPAFALALGAALASAFSLLACLLVVPPLLALDGRRAAGDGELRHERRLATALGALPRGLARGTGRAMAAALVALVAALTLASPALDAESLPLGADAGADELVAELPLAAAAAGVLVALAFGLRSRSVRAIPFAALAGLPAAAAVGVLTIVFHEGAGPFGLEIGQARIPTSGALAAGVTALVAITAARTAAALDGVRFERELDPGAPGVAERVAELTLPAALIGTVLVGAAFGVLAGADLGAAQELGVMIAAGLLVDLLLLRAPTVAALARWSGPRARPERPPRRLGIRWPGWRKSRAEQGSTASPS